MLFIFKEKQWQTMILETLEVSMDSKSLPSTPTSKCIAPSERPARADLMSPHMMQESKNALFATVGQNGPFKTSLIKPLDRQLLVK